MRSRLVLFPSLLLLLTIGCATARPNATAGNDPCDGCPKLTWCANCTGPCDAPGPLCNDDSKPGPDKPGCGEEGGRLCEDGLPPVAGPSPFGCPSTDTPCGLGPYTPGTIQFAVIGDWGDNCCRPSCSTFVADMIKGWNSRWPIEFIVTTGDNFYPNGSQEALEANMPMYEWVDPRAFRFFPSIGNHDLYDNCCGRAYQSYFSHLNSYSRTHDHPRYYRYPVPGGLIDLFSLNSDNGEPDGNTQDSVQATWLQNELKASQAIWKIVYFHNPPYNTHGGQSPAMRWPFAEWGASIVLTGHVHAYERLVRDGLTYVSNGIGGVKGVDHITVEDGCTPVEGSIVQYNGSVGAMIGVATKDALRFCLLAVDRDHPDGVCIDSFTLARPSGS